MLRTGGIFFVSFIASCLALAPMPATAAHTIDEQRALFQAKWPEAKRGRWTLTAAEERVLADYILWPDLRGRYLETKLRRGRGADADAFLRHYPNTQAASSLRYRLARKHASRGRWADYLAIYYEHFSERGDTVLDCLAVTGQIRTAAPVDSVLAFDHWRVGKSQPPECDPVFAWLRATGMLDETEIRARFDLALAAEEFTLAAFLARDLDAHTRRVSKQWKALRDNPRRALTRTWTLADTQEQRRYIAYGIKRLAREDTAYADILWRELQTTYAFDAELAYEVGEYIALVASWRHQPRALRLIARLDPERRSAELLGWQVRAALRAADWREVLKAVALMDTVEANEDRWRYWHAAALIELGNDSEGESELRLLARERSFYGFLAADRMNLPYSFGHQALQADSNALAALADNPALLRARELYLTGLARRGRAAWDAAIATLDPEGKAQAAMLADRWGWHSRAIATAASGGHFDDLNLRYPLPWQQWFESYSAEASIAPTWAYGIARSESLFMRDVRSPAGAVGLMQLMPATGRQTAKESRVPYAGRKTLADPRSNIFLGTRYLGNMYERFGHSQVLATAAYNAGPHRVDRWLPREHAMPAEIWIETIPYDETREYVQRVLTAGAVFHWRITSDTLRVSNQLQPIARPAHRVAMTAPRPKPGS